MVGDGCESGVNMASAMALEESLSLWRKPAISGVSCVKIMDARK